MGNFVILAIAILFSLNGCSKKRKEEAVIEKENPVVLTSASIPARRIILSDLPDSLQPSVVDISVSTEPSKKSIQVPPEKNYLPFLRNRNGDNILDKDGNPYLMGKGGKSFFANFNTENGLASDIVNSSLLDKNGNLWFGTLGGGVSRFDGKSFTNFTMNQGLPDNSVMGIVEDNNGNIWFATYNGVSRYDGRSFTNFWKEQGLADNRVYSVIKDKQGNLWFGTLGGGVSCFNGSTFSNFTTKEGLASNNVLSIRQDRKGNLWFGTMDSGVCTYNGQSFSKFTTSQGLANNNVLSITEDRSGKLWFGTNGGGVSCFNGYSFTNYSTAQGLAGNSIQSITEDDVGNIWFGSYNGGVSQFDGNSFVTYTTAQGLSNNSILTILKDRFGNLWFGTYGGGICPFSDNSFTSFSKTQGLADNKVVSIVEDTTGNIWFGTNGGGVSCYNGYSFTNYSIDQGLPSNSISSLEIDNKGTVWLGTNGKGISRFDGKSFFTYTTAQGLIDNTVHCIKVDRSGYLWIGTDGGVSMYNGKSFTNFTTAQGLPDNSVYSILEEKTGDLWFATRAGASRYDGKSLTNFTTTQGLVNNYISNIAEDGNGNIWFGTNGGGISRYNGKGFDNFTVTEGLPANVVDGIVQDKQGNILISTALGFTLIPARAVSFPFSKITHELQLYSGNYGFSIKGINANALFCDSKGIIWAGTGSEKTSLIKFDLSSVKKNVKTPDLAIQSIKINEENIGWYGYNHSFSTGEVDSSFKSIILSEEVTLFGRGLTTTERKRLKQRFRNIKFDSITPYYPKPVNLVLPHKFNNISFEFNAIETGAPQLVNYQYILEGYSEEWSPVFKKTNATFGNIKEGLYTFRLKAQAPNGVWTEPVTYSFRVLPPWHRTWWANFIYLTIIVLIGWRFYFFQKARILRKEKEKSIENELIHAREIEKAYTKLKSAQVQLIHSEKMASLGQLTAGIAHEIQNPLNFVNNFSEVNKELTVELEEKIDKGNYVDAKSIAKDIRENEEKINQHGKRADAIVKGMLQHSRSSSGQKEPTDINALCDEYLRLAYHGLRAKDKSFNTDIKTDFDPSVGMVAVVPQDFGRVLLNLINNAFYAVNEREKLKANSQQLTASSYQPVVSVSTKKTGNNVVITVADNGSGIPQKVLDKIFQPFFTTKPTGKGTGLGLSLSYDIVKAHGGEIKVNSKENEGAEFIIFLPA